MRTYAFKCNNPDCVNYQVEQEFDFSIEEYTNARDNMLCGSCQQKMIRSYHKTPIIYKMTYGPDEFGDI